MEIPFEKREAAELLIQAGINNPFRLLDQIRKQISFFELNLNGLTVLTEAASGPYVVTPIIANLAGAKRVVALTQDSTYASSEKVISQTRALEILCDCPIRTEIHTDRAFKYFSDADIVTNLGFVRPLNKDVIFSMKRTAVISLMCEAWEFRPDDIDLKACNARNIIVLGTNEDYPGLEVFAYSGYLCVKLLFEAQIEIHKSRLLVVSSDKFGIVISHLLKCMGANVSFIDHINLLELRKLGKFDAIVIADYTRSDNIIGTGGDISVKDYSSAQPGVTLIQFAGKNDVNALTDCGIQVYPGINLPSHRMAQTLAFLGPQPVIDLHTAGLKVGELASRNERDKFHKLIQEMMS